MTKLIKNELYKIFHKKSIYVMGIIVIFLILLNNVLYKVFYDDSGNFKDIDVSSNYELTLIEEELKNLDPNKETDKNLYIEYKSQYDVYSLASNYSTSSWQYYIINNKMYEVIYNKYYYTYIDKSDKLLKEAENTYNKYLSYLEKDDFKEFAYLELKEVEDAIISLSKEKSTTTDKQRLLEIDTSIKSLEFDKEIINYRIDKNISYANNYLNTALDKYKEAHNYLESIENIDNLTYEERLLYNEKLEEYNINKYILDNNTDLNRENTTRSSLINALESYEIFVIILIIIIAGTIVSNEFSKGTIKGLLVRPYSRTKILLAKFVSSLIILVISIIFVLVCNLLISGIFFSFDSLSIPVVIYNFNTGLIEEYNVFTYVLIRTLAYLPMFIIILTISFMLSTVTTNSQISIALPFVFYMFSSVINAMAMSFNLKWMKYFITLNWNLNDYLFGNLPSFPYGSFTNAIVINIIYFIVLLLIAILVFRKKNIKNI
ncbi:MAG: ABC transporter permease subunit [Bacilli bacterium]